MVAITIEIGIRKVPTKRGSGSRKRSLKGFDILCGNHQMEGVDIRIYCHARLEGYRISASSVDNEGQLGVLLYKHPRFQKGSSRIKEHSAAAQGAGR